MAKIETKSVSVLPREEQDVIKFYEKFGWTVQSSQEIFNRDTRDEVRKNTMGDDELWNVTTTTNYVKIIFQRDKEIDNYKKLCELQEEYETNEFIFKKAPGIMPGKILSIVIGLCLIACISGFVNGQVGVGFVGLIFGGGIFAARYFLRYKPNDEKASAAYLRNQEIDKELEKLV